MAYARIFDKQILMQFPKYEIIKNAIFFASIHPLVAISPTRAIRYRKKLFIYYMYRYKVVYIQIYSRRSYFAFTFEVKRKSRRAQSGATRWPVLQQIMSNLRGPAWPLSMGRTGRPVDSFRREGGTQVRKIIAAARRWHLNIRVARKSQRLRKIGGAAAAAITSRYAEPSPICPSV